MLLVWYDKILFNNSISVIDLFNQNTLHTENGFKLLYCVRLYVCLLSDSVSSPKCGVQLFADRVILMEIFFTRKIALFVAYLL